MHGQRPDKHRGFEYASCWMWLPQCTDSGYVPGSTPNTYNLVVVGDRRGQSRQKKERLRGQAWWGGFQEWHVIRITDPPLSAVNAVQGGSAEKALAVVRGRYSLGALG